MHVPYLNEDQTKLLLAVLDVDPSKSYIEMGDIAYHELLSNLNPAQWFVENSDPQKGYKRFELCGVKIKDCKYLIGWRLLSSRLPINHVVDYCIQERGKPNMHVWAISSNYDDREQTKYQKYNG